MLEPEFLLLSVFVYIQNFQDWLPDVKEISLYCGFRIDGPASSWPRRHGKSKSSWPSKNGFGHNSAGLSPILIRICMVKNTIMNKSFRAPGPHGTDF